MENDFKLILHASQYTYAQDALGEELALYFMS